MHKLARMVLGGRKLTGTARLKAQHIQQIS
jgi:hypothetical protein